MNAKVTIEVECVKNLAPTLKTMLRYACIGRFWGKAPSTRALGHTGTATEEVGDHKPFKRTWFA